MKAEGKEDRGGMKSEQKAEQKGEQKGQTTGQGTMQRDQGTARSAGDERELLDFGRHPRTARRDLPHVAGASGDDLSGMAPV